MFQVLPSMKHQFTQISLSRLSQILTEHKPHPLTQHFDELLQSFFQIDQELEESQYKALQLIYDQPLERKEFFELLSKSLLKILRRELKKIEELINHHSRNNQQVEFSRIKLDKVLKECFLRLQDSAGGIFEFVENYQSQQNWDCRCNKDQCNSRQSPQQFIIDIFGFFIRSSQVVNKEVESAEKREKLPHPIFKPTFEANKKQDWQCGKNAGELVLQMEKECQKAKAKKRKRNKKAKHKQSEQIFNQQISQFDQQQRTLNCFLNSLAINQQQRLPCVVTEEWRQRITQRHFIPEK